MIEVEEITLNTLQIKSKPDDRQHTAEFSIDIPININILRPEFDADGKPAMMNPEGFNRKIAERIRKWISELITEVMKNHPPTQRSGNIQHTVEYKLEGKNKVEKVKVIDEKILIKNRLMISITFSTETPSEPLHLLQDAQIKENMVQTGMNIVEQTYKNIINI